MINGSFETLLFLIRFLTQSTKEGINISCYNAEKHEIRAESMSQNIGSYLIPLIWGALLKSLHIKRLVLIRYSCRTTSSLPNYKEKWICGPHMINFFLEINQLTRFCDERLWLQNAVEQPSKYFGGWVGAYTINAFVIGWVLVVGFGFGGWASMINFIHQIDTFGLFTKCYQCLPPPMATPPILNSTAAPPPHPHPHFHPHWLWLPPSSLILQSTRATSNASLI